MMSNIITLLQEHGRELNHPYTDTIQKIRDTPEENYTLLCVQTNIYILLCSQYKYILQIFVFVFACKLFKVVKWLYIFKELKS